MQRENPFLHLAGEGFLVGQEEIFGQLLGDGGAALGSPSGTNVHPDGSQDGLEVDAGVAKKICIFDGNDRLPEPGRDVGKRHNQAALFAKLAQQRAVPGIDSCQDRGGVILQGLHLRQVALQEGGGTHADSRRQHPGRKGSDETSLSSGRPGAGVCDRRCAENDVKQAAERGVPWPTL